MQELLVKLQPSRSLLTGKHGGGEGAGGVRASVKQIDRYKANGNSAAEANRWSASVPLTNFALCVAGGGQ